MRGHRRRGVLAPLVLATAVGSTGLAAGGTAGALLAADITGTSAAAGLPLGLLVVGTAVGALPISHQAARGHRGRGLALGCSLGVAGAAVVIAASVARNLPMLLVGSAVLGAANSAVFLTRYAGAEAGGESGRGRSLGAVLAATAIGAVFSPLLLGPSAAVAAAVGLPRLSGLYLVALVAFGVSALLFAASSTPRAPWFGRAATVLARGCPGRDPESAALARTLLDARSAPAFVALAATNVVMVGTMALAPVKLLAHGHGMALIGTVIALHVAGMFAPSPVSGALADRCGPAAVVLLGLSVLLTTSLAGAFVDEHHVLAMAGHLLLLGVGWNCGVVGGSALLAGATPDRLRPHAEGVGDVVMGLAAAAGAPLAGVLVVLGGHRTLSLVSAMVALFALVFVHRRNRPVRTVPAVGLDHGGGGGA